MQWFYYAWVRVEKDVASQTVNICFLHCETWDVIEPIQTILYTPARQSNKTLELDKLCVMKVFFDTENLKCHLENLGLLVTDTREPLCNTVI